MPLQTGTPETQTRHSRVLGTLNEAVVMAIPAVLLVGGISIIGWDAIGWSGALLWGMVAATVMSGLLALARRSHLTSLNLIDLLGSTVSEARTLYGQFTGYLIHLVVGALLAVTGAYTLTLIGWAVTWLTGMIWAGFMGILALMMLSSLGVVHPKIRNHQEVDPGPVGSNLGGLTPVLVMGGHLVYGAVFGGLYQIWPLT